MLGLFCSAALYRARVLAAFPAHQTVMVTDTWQHFERLLSEAAGAVVVLPWLSDDAFPSLCALAARNVAWPLVLVTMRDADNARYLKDVAADEVVWLGEVERELWPAVQRATSAHTLPLRAVADQVEETEHLPVTLRRALGYACRSRTPVRSVTALASAVSCRRSTLWYHWNRAVDAEGQLRLEDFLDWLLVLHALGRKGPGHAWPKVAEELGVHERTLGRAARRLSGVRLQDLTLRGQGAAMALFRERMLYPLLGGYDQTFCADLGRFAVAKE